MLSTLVFSLLAIGLLALIFGAALGYASIKFKVEGNPLADQIDAILPQTQCGQCGYPGCRPYAEAMAKDEAAINLCPPGGQDTVEALAALLGKEVIALEAEEAAQKEKALAIIDEQECIGCTLCLRECPVDAIVGATKLMHTVIGSECTGCELCVPVCPVDCIHMETIAPTPATWVWPTPPNPLEVDTHLTKLTKLAKAS